MSNVIFAVTVFLLTTSFSSAIAQGLQSCPEGWQKHTSSCYRVYDMTTANVDSAYSTCDESDAHLVTIHDEAENAFVLNLIAAAFPSPPVAPNYLRIFNGMKASRNEAGDLVSVTWVDATSMGFGDPFKPDFVTGTYPWSNGTAYNGVPEPKHSATAVHGFIVINDKLPGGWALGPLDSSITLNGAFVCEKAVNNAYK